MTMSSGSLPFVIPLVDSVVVKSYMALSLTDKETPIVMSETRLNVETPEHLVDQPLML
jgi:hypothetical protein